MEGRRVREGLDSRTGKFHYSCCALRKTVAIEQRAQGVDRLGNEETPGVTGSRWPHARSVDRSLDGPCDHSTADGVSASSVTMPSGAPGRAGAGRAQRGAGNGGADVLSTD
jgi:hypothetical protein